MSKQFRPLTGSGDHRSPATEVIYSELNLLQEKDPKQAAIVSTHIREELTMFHGLTPLESAGVARSAETMGAYAAHHGGPGVLGIALLALVSGIRQQVDPESTWVLEPEDLPASYRDGYRTAGEIQLPCGHPRNSDEFHQWMLGLTHAFMDGATGYAGPVASPGPGGVAGKTAPLGEPVDRGIQAANDGKTLADNPYNRINDGTGYREWLRGFTLGTERGLRAGTPAEPVVDPATYVGTVEYQRGYDAGFGNTPDENPYKGPIDAMESQDVMTHRKDLYAKWEAGWEKGRQDRVGSSGDESLHATQEQEEQEQQESGTGDDKYAGQRIFAVDRQFVANTLALPEIPQGFFRSHDPEAFVHLLEQNGMYVPRGPAEVNPALKQLIPYIIVVCEGQVLTYSRGKKGAEDRLHAKRSLGIGGHVDVLEEGQEEHRGGPLRRTALKELVDETGLGEGDILDAELLGFINNEKDPVGQVHLGVLLLVQIEPRSRFKLKHDEEDGLTDPLWEPLVNPMDGSRVSRYDSFEAWSQIVIDTVLNEERHTDLGQDLACLAVPQLILDGWAAGRKTVAEDTGDVPNPHQGDDGYVFNAGVSLYFNSLQGFNEVEAARTAQNLRTQAEGTPGQGDRREEPLPESI